MAEATATAKGGQVLGEHSPQQLAVLDSLGMALAQKRKAAIDARVNAGIDQRWYDDVEAYEGRDEVSRQYEGLRARVQGYIETADPTKQKRSTIVVNVTRSKVNASSARLQEVGLPTDDRNWDLAPSTVPELVAQMGQKHIGLLKNGKPVMVNDNGAQRQATMADLAQRDMDRAKEAAQAMRDEIDDQLDMSQDGCGIEGVMRQMMDDEALLGVGVIKGPVVTSRTKKVWMPITSGGKTMHVLQYLQDRKPGSSRVNPWDIYPHQSCGENPKKFPIWERIPGVTGADLRKYADIPGYIVPQIVKVLREGPRRPDQPPLKPNESPAVAITDETVFEAWEYHGELQREELRAAGVEVGDSDSDLMKTISATVIMVNNTVIKADIEILDTEEMPYDFFVTNRRAGAWDGYGTAFLARCAQKVITAAWRAMLDHAGQFIGPQIVVNRGGMAPADGVWEVRGMKLWWYTGTDPQADMGKMFGLHEISSHQAEYANIIRMGMDFLDQETAIPMLAQGEQGTAPELLGGMNLLLNASNVLMRRKLKALDDQVTIPHIGRYVDWNMQYSPKAEIKGDFEVQARASGALMDREMQNRGASNLMQMALHPKLEYGMKKWSAVRRVVQALRYAPDDFVKPDEEIKVIEQRMAEEQSAMPSDPRIAVAKINAQLKQLEWQFEQQENEKDRQSKELIAMIDKQIADSELSSVERQVLERLKVQLTETAMKLTTQKQLSLADHKVDLHKSAPALTAPTEPAGRAPAGQAWER